MENDMRKLIKRLRNVPLFPVIPLVPIGIVVSDIVFSILNFRRLKRLEARAVRPLNGRPARVAAARA
jgi:hypothetical protein